VDTPNGKATLSDVYVTELGYVMAKLYFPKRGVWINYKIGEIKNLLEGSNLRLLSEFESIKIKKIKKLVS
jgi:hypothetical protein